MTSQQLASSNSENRGPTMAASASPKFGSRVTNSVRQSFGRLRRHDSEFSVSSDYDYASPNDLNVWQGAALLTADCLGTGILALPQDIHALGVWFGVGFLILNLSINLYAGTILSNAALDVERKQGFENERFQQLPPIIESGLGGGGGENSKQSSGEEDELSTESPLQDGKKLGGSKNNYDTLASNDVFEDEDPNDKHESLHHDTATFDFVGMTSALFHKTQETRWVMVLYYTNIFLVLGDYILVMSHAVAALLGEDWVCLPQAGILASTLMFAVSQLRTMANLGRSASIISLSALFVVVLQCVYYANSGDQEIDQDVLGTIDATSESTSILRKLSALGSIGFAVGSQKLFLNIRHELADREAAPKTLAVSLSAFGTFYVVVVLLAGSNPPGFLFDAIPAGVGRRIAGFFLWIHVVVSYAINSQAICSSMDRIFFYRWGPVSSLQDHHRWMLLTGFMAVSAFFVANAIPFFKDLVSLIGALTSVPLTLLLPAIFHRKLLGVSIWLPTMSSLASYSLLLFALVFMFSALVGAVQSIFSDWEHNSGGFFACH